MKCKITEVKKHIIKQIERVKRRPTDLVAASQLTRSLVKLSQGVDFEWIETKHFKKELENDGCDTMDAMNVLENGTISEAPELCIHSGNNIYRVHGKTIDGDDAVVCEILLLSEDDVTGIKLITFWKKGH